jgi:hypothetical protein
LQVFEPLADPLTQAANRTFGPPKLESDLRGRIALEAKLEDWPFVRANVPKQGFDRLGEDHRFLRPRLAVQGCQLWVGPFSGRLSGYLAGRVASACSEVPSPIGALPQSYQGQQVPQTAPVTDLQFALTMADEETLEGRLNHIFGIDLSSKELVELPSCESDQSGSEAIEHFSGGRILAGAESRHQVMGRVVI